ncbi:MAG: DUF4291 domain-containing protein [Chitinophagaceae bacterium]|nr:DUF4291 domain-containing protein [Chitinophagaceae bacterium]
MKTEQYTVQKQRLPKTGKQIMGSVENDNIIVYQAYNHKIAEYAVRHQRLGGSDYSFNRMSWIKPGFLWMMHRSGWATKENQEKILAITLPVVHFKTILQQATISSFDDSVYPSEAAWKLELAKTEVRLQWDPDHDPFGNKEARKAIQIGMKGDILKQFCSEWSIKIEDITEFVKNEYRKIQQGNVKQLDVPYETILHLNDPAIEKRIGISSNTI